VRYILPRACTSCAIVISQQQVVPAKSYFEMSCRPRLEGLFKPAAEMYWRVSWLRVDSRLPEVGSIKLGLIDMRWAGCNEASQPCIELDSLLVIRLLKRRKRTERVGLREMVGVAKAGT
jgi:hypothetical protein